jgi:hypothetical protein
MENVHTTLTVGFWFGDEMPSYDSEIFTKTFDGENLLTEYLTFKSEYEAFKRINKNNPLPYKEVLENEQCYIFFPEPVGPQLSTFLEVRLMAEHLYKVSASVNQEIEELNAEIEALEEQKREFEQIREKIF